MVTRSQAQAQFDHICNVVLRCDDESPLKKALVQEGFDDVPSLLSIADGTIPSLAYKAEGDRTIVIRHGDMALVRSFWNFVMTRMASGITVEDEWLAMTAEDFDAFRVRCLCMRFNVAGDEGAHVAATDPTPPPSTIINQRGTKRDSSNTTALKGGYFPLVSSAIARHDAQEEAKRGKWQGTRTDDDTFTASEQKDTGTAGNAVNDREQGTGASLTTPSEYTPKEVRSAMSNPDVRNVNVANLTYTVSAHRSTQPMLLVDRGANVRVIGRIFRSVDIQGIDNHQVTDIGIGTVGGVDTQVTDIYGIKNDKQFVNTLEDNIESVEHPTSSLVTEAQSSSASTYWISCAHYASVIGRASQRCSTRTTPSGATKLSRQQPTVSWTELEHHHSHGFSAFNMCVTCSTTPTMPTSTISLLRL
jgi:hypothetical protein